jgi:hypothetical protein
MTVADHAGRGALVTLDEAWARLRAATDGLPAGWTTAEHGPARVFTVTTGSTGQIELEVCFYGPPQVFGTTGDFDSAAITRGDPYMVATVAPAGHGQRLADLGSSLGGGTTVVTIGETDLVVGSSRSVARDDVERFVAFVAGTAS